MGPQSNTGFYRKWGITSHELAEKEGVTHTAIHMRVLHWGNPFQRKANPTKIEILTGMCMIEFCLKYNVAPLTISARLRYKPFVDNDTLGDVDSRLGPRTNCWKDDPLYKNQRFWLMPEHPDYEEARKPIYERATTRNVRGIK